MEGVSHNISQDFFVGKWYDPLGGENMKGLWKKVALGIGMLWVVGVASSILAGDFSLPMEEQPNPTTILEQKVHTIQLLSNGEIHGMELEEYVTGVVLCEMPTGFYMEAKKAQAVAARTFALRTSGQGLRHGVGVICSEATCCQGYYSPEEYLRLGGTEEGIAQARQAAGQTRGKVLTYGGSLIEATYFSCSGGRTEDAVAVWGMDIPYLQAVDSPGEEQAAYYTDTVRFSAAEFQNALGVQLTGRPVQWFGAVSYTDGNGVGTMEIGGKTYTGAQLRQILQLRSSSFTVTALSDCVLITTRGYGHRVGMSQYGAEAMAQSGSGWKDILEHYYQGVSIEELE